MITHNINVIIIRLQTFLNVFFKGTIRNEQEVTQTTKLMHMCYQLYTKQKIFTHNSTFFTQLF